MHNPHVFVTKRNLRKEVLGDLAEQSQYTPYGVLLFTGHNMNHFIHIRTHHTSQEMPHFGHQGTTTSQANDEITSNLC